MISQVFEREVEIMSKNECRLMKKRSSLLQTVIKWSILFLLPLSFFLSPLFHFNSGTNCKWHPHKKLSSFGLSHFTFYSFLFSFSSLREVLFLTEEKVDDSWYTDQLFICIITIFGWRNKEIAQKEREREGFKEMWRNTRRIPCVTSHEKKVTKKLMVKKFHR